MSSSSSHPESQVVAEENRRASFMTLVDAAASEFDSKPAPTDKTSTTAPSATVSVSSSVTSSDSSLDGSDSVDKQASQESGLEKKLSFAEQLMSILDDEAYADVLHWMPDGKSFTITNPKKFTSEEMPKLFNIRNMSSFVRKLTRWGFSRVHERETMNSDIFKHPQFQKGDYKLCAEIKCTGRTSASSSTLRRPSLEAINALKSFQAKPPSDVVIPPKVPLPGSSSTMRAPAHSDLASYQQTRNSLSSFDAHVLAATVETIRRERELSNILGLQRMMDASKQPQSWLNAARAEQLLRLERAQLGGRMAWGGFPALY
jgi:hypothetical protein